MEPGFEQIHLAQKSRIFLPPHTIFSRVLSSQNTTAWPLLRCYLILRVWMFSLPIKSLQEPGLIPSLHLAVATPRAEHRPGPVYWLTRGVRMHLRVIEPAVLILLA